MALERASDRKHEYVAGIIVAMAGARPPHNILAANVLSALVQLCRGGPCVTMTSAQRVYVQTTKLYAYPDVTVTCGERSYDGGDPPSPFLHYQAIRELREYLIISHRERRIDHYRRLEPAQRDKAEWSLATYALDETTIEIPSLGGAFGLSDVYAGVDFSEGRRTLRGESPG